MSKGAQRLRARAGLGLWPAGLESTNLAQPLSHGNSLTSKSKQITTKIQRERRW